MLGVPEREAGWRGGRSGGREWVADPGRKAKGKERRAERTISGKFDGRVQQRMEKTLGAITLSNKSMRSARLNPFQSFGG